MELPQGTVALVTGAARGLGWGIARAFGQAGARVCAIDVNVAELQRCARDLADDGAEFMAQRFGFDLRDWHFGSLLDPSVAHKVVPVWNLGVTKRYWTLARLTRPFRWAWSVRPIHVNRRFGNHSTDDLANLVWISFAVQQMKVGQPCGFYESLQ